MKIREGFVSNSSSSSFIVHNSQVSEENWIALKDFLDEVMAKYIEEDKCLDWSGRDFSFCVSNGFIEIGDMYLDGKYMNKIKELLGGIYPDEVYHNYD